jgi:hypothetical protein
LRLTPEVSFQQPAQTGRKPADQKTAALTTLCHTAQLQADVAR